MKVALYVRVSTEEQVDEGFSIEGQIQTLSDYCRKKNYTIINIYKDKGISGKSINRPQLKQLLEDCEKRLFEEVIVWKISRLSRKQVDFLNTIELFEKNNVGFYSFSENIRASTPQERAMLQMMGVFAELDRNNTVENVKMGMKQRAKEGKWNGGVALGYTSKDKKLVKVDDEAQIVRHIFNLYINGKGYKAIANQLNHERYKTKKGGTFAVSTVRTIITNPIYAGYIRFNQVANWSEKRRKGKSEDIVFAKGQHESIIDIETWEKAQAILNQKSNKPAKTFTGHFPLTTLLRCPMCGHGMIGHRTKNSNDTYIRYYQCGNFRSKGSAICKSNLVRADYAEEFVFNRLEQLASNPSLLEVIVERVNGRIGTLKEPIQNQLEYIEGQIKNILKNIAKFINIIEKSDNLPEAILDKISTLEVEEKEYLKQKKELEYELNKPTIKEISFEQIYYILDNFSKIFPKVEAEQQKDLLHSIIYKIRVNLGNRPDQRSVKDIELFFDASLKDDFVLTYGTVPPY